MPYYKDKEQEVFPKDPNKSYGLMMLMCKQAPGVDVGGPEETVFAWPHLLMRALVLFLAVLIVLIGISLLFDAPLEEMANPDRPTNPAKAPWYFLGLQEMVSYSASWGGVYIPTLIIVGLMLVPYIDRSPQGQGVWFALNRLWPNIYFMVFALAMLALIIIGYYFRGPNWAFVTPW